LATTCGKKAPRKIRKIGEIPPMPNQRMAIGVQAIGEIGRISWKSGFSARCSGANHPIRIPSGMAMAVAAK
jgi:hypothetical protein